MKEKIKFYVLTILLFLPIIFYTWYSIDKSIWLIYASLITFSIGIIILLCLTIYLLSKRKENNLLDNLEEFYKKEKIKIDDNYFCPICKSFVDKDAQICPKCKNKFHKS